MHLCIFYRIFWMTSVIYSLSIPPRTFVQKKSRRKEGPCLKSMANAWAHLKQTDQQTQEVKTEHVPRNICAEIWKNLTSLAIWSSAWSSTLLRVLPRRLPPAPGLSILRTRSRALLLLSIYRFISIRRAYVFFCNGYWLLRNPLRVYCRLIHV